MYLGVILIFSQFLWLLQGHCNVFSVVVFITQLTATHQNHALNQSNVTATHSLVSLSSGEMCPMIPLPVTNVAQLIIVIDICAVTRGKKCFGKGVVTLLVAIVPFVVFTTSGETDTTCTRSTLESAGTMNTGRFADEKFINKSNKQEPYIEEDLNSSSKQNDKGSSVSASNNWRTYINLKLLFKTREVVQTSRCRSIFDGDETEMTNAKVISENIPKRAISPQQYINMTQNCGRFIKNRGYITYSLTKDEKDFPISFSLILYDYVEQAERLLRAIYRPQNVYCIHVDSKARPEIYQAVLSIANCFENVFTSRRIEVTWGAHTVLEPELICMEELWNKSKRWKYFINLTGQEFPLKTNYEIVKILKAYNGSNDVLASTERHNKVYKRIASAGTPPHGVVPRKGSIHIVVSRDYVDYVLHDQRARDILNWSSYTRHSSEIFFSTIHGNRFLNAPGSNKGDRTQDIVSAARYKKWRGPCHGKLGRNICILAVGDLPVLASTFQLFANKFHWDYYPIVLDCLEELNFNRTRDQFLGKVGFDARRYVDGGFLVNN